MTQFLTLDQVSKLAPSALATGHDGNRSDRYTFVSSRDVIETFEGMGWGVAGAMQPKSRKSDPAHNKHILRFRPKDGGLAFRDPRGGKDVFPEIICNNSSNGTSRFLLESGAFSMICSNGLTIRVAGFEEIGEKFSRKHIGWDASLAFDTIKKMEESFGSFFTVVAEMTQHDLSPEQRFTFADMARKIRFQGNDSLDPKVLLTPRREADMGTDVWTTYNVIQENCVRGGFKLNKRTSRELTNIDALQKVNASLWDAAEETLALAMA